MGKPIDASQVIAQEVQRMRLQAPPKAAGEAAGATPSGPSTVPLADRLGAMALPGADQAQQHQPQRGDRPIQPLPAGPAGKARNKKPKAKQPQAPDGAADKTRAALLARIAAPAAEGEARLEHEIRNLYEVSRDGVAGYVFRSGC